MSNRSSSRSWIREWIYVAILAFIISIVLRSFAFEIFKIPSGSMIPTLIEGDYVLVTKYSYGFGRYSFPLGLIPFSGRIWFTPPQRGEVAVFRHPKRNDIDFIKRVVGLPGDTIQMREGVLHINNRAVTKILQQSSADTTDTTNNAYNADNNNTVQRPFPRYLEKLPDSSAQYLVQEMSFNQGRVDNTPPYVVPPKHYFMMGDNRDNSIDSRYINDVGMVREDYLVGRAAFVLYSFDVDASIWTFWRWSDTIQPNRAFLKL